MDMQDTANGRKGPTHRGILSRIARDKKGNTLAIVGAALVPLTAMIGSGVDMSRAYMAKQRLQSACDAAALAGRRVMTNDQMSDTVRDEARAYFNFNFAPGAYQTTSFTPDVSRSAPGTIRVSAATNIPTSIMRLFGYTTLPLSVTCDASLNYVNTDVVLVLDVTGSMASALAGTPKINALRDAVMALYDQLAPVQAQLEAAGLRLRYGIVPYSSTVNVGELIRNADPNYLLSNAEYQTVVLNYNTPAAWTGTPGTPETPVNQTYGSSISQAECDLYGQNQAFSGFTPSPTTGGGPPPAPGWTRAFSNNEAAGTDWGWSGASDTSGTNRSCRRRYVETDVTYTVSAYRFTSASYEAESMDTSRLKTGAAVNVAVDVNGTVPTAGTYDLAELARDGTGVSIGSSTWNGCIQERDTVNTITPSANLTIPAAAYDLDINLIPNSDETRWRPMWPAITFRRTAGSTSATSGTSMGGSACPAEARRLTAWTRGNLLAYVNGLQPVGSTYHDIGMIWGARMISRGGIFADSPDTFNNMPVARHIIFMTDGQMDTDNSIYAFHGIERNDQRVSGQSNPTETDLNGRHMQRFQMACNAARGAATGGASIWVIAFGTTVSPEMQACASNANQVSTAADRTQLIQRFAEIGQNIGALRLTQ